MKKIILSLSIISFIILSAIGGVYLLSKHIFNQTSCKRFNIDNIEVRTGIDIPSVSKVDCNCKNNIKTSTFILNSKEVNIQHYISRNDFVPKGNIYVNNGKNEHTKWDAILDSKANTLKVTIQYQNL